MGQFKPTFGKYGILEGVIKSLDIKQGEFVGIAGQSGSGKSTLMKLLPRLYEVEQGTITIDGYDINKFNTKSLRKFIASASRY